MHVCMHHMHSHKNRYLENFSLQKKITKSLKLMQDYTIKPHT